MNKNSEAYKMEFEKIKTILVLLLVMISGKGVSLTKEMENLSTQFGGILLLLILAVALISTKNLLPKKFFIIIGIWTLYNMLLSIRDGDIYPRFYTIFILQFLFAYAVFKIHGIMLFYKVEKIIYYLSVLSLFLYSWSLLHVESLKAILEPLNFGHQSFSTMYKNAYYCFFYTHLEYKYGISFIEYRNAGFCWEPGYFASILIVAMIMNMIRTEFKPNRYLIVFVVSLLTTFSTTGIIAGIILWFWYLFEVGKAKSFVYFLPPMLIAFILIANQPFVKQKINNSMQESVDVAINRALNNDFSEFYYTPQRISSFLIGWIDFTEKPILGYGADRSKRWFNEKYSSIELTPISGIGNLIGQFGLFGILFVIINLYRSANFFCRLFNLKYPIFYILIFLTISFSYSVYLNTAFFMIFIFLNWFYYPQKEK